MDRIWLRTPGDTVLLHTLPLSEFIERQWRDGTLVRVNEDGSAFEGDQYALLSGDGVGEAVTAAPGGEDPDGDQGGAPDRGEGDPDGPVRPSPNAAKPEWVAFAVGLGVCASEEEANAMTKADLIAKTTPPELDPEA
ncbi:hypothetical protein [Actinoallomurus sp. NPDC052274]|uniref:hypothetical protein n=1 Tax=Actinoallomurus sp. NPDC052274 TaxID=3155420 RepID=UPI0034479F0C